MKTQVNNINNTSFYSLYRNKRENVSYNNEENCSYSYLDNTSFNNKGHGKSQSLLLNKKPRTYESSYANSKKALMLFVVFLIIVSNIKTVVSKSSIKSNSAEYTDNIKSLNNYERDLVSFDSSLADFDNSEYEKQELRNYALRTEGLSKEAVIRNFSRFNRNVDKMLRKELSKNNYISEKNKNNRMLTTNSENNDTPSSSNPTTDSTLLDNEFEATIAFVTPSSSNFFSLQDGNISKPETYNTLFTKSNPENTINKVFNPSKPAILILSKDSLTIKYYTSIAAKKSTSTIINPEIITFSLSEFTYLNNNNSIDLNIDYTQLDKTNNKNTNELLTSLTHSMLSELDSESKAFLLQDYDSSNNNKLVYLLSRNSKDTYYTKYEESEKTFLIINIIPNKNQNRDKFKQNIDLYYSSMISESKILPTNVFLYQEFYSSYVQIKNIKKEILVNKNNNEFVLSNKYDVSNVSNYRIVINSSNDEFTIYSKNEDSDSNSSNLSSLFNKEKISFKLSEVISFSGLYYQNIFDERSDCVVISVLSFSEEKFYAVTSDNPISFINICFSNYNNTKTNNYLINSYFSLSTSLFRLSLLNETIKVNIKQMNLQCITNKSFNAEELYSSNTKTTTPVNDYIDNKKLEVYLYNINLFNTNNSNNKEIKLLLHKFNLEKILKTYFILKQLPLEDFISDSFTRYKAQALKKLSPKLLNDLLLRYSLSKNKTDKKNEIIQGQINKLSLDIYSKFYLSNIEAVIESNKEELIIKINQTVDKDYDSEKYNSNTTTGDNYFNTRITKIKKFISSQLETDASNTYEISIHSQNALICLFDNNFIIDVDFILNLDKTILDHENKQDKYKIVYSNEADKDDNDNVFYFKLRNAYLGNSNINTKMTLFLLKKCDNTLIKNFAFEYYNVESIYKTLDESNFESMIGEFFSENIEEESLSSAMIGEYDIDLSDNNNVESKASEFSLLFRNSKKKNNNANDIDKDEKINNNNAAYIPSSFNYVLQYNHNNYSQKLLQHENNSYNALFFDKRDGVSLYMIYGKKEIIKHLQTLNKEIPLTERKSISEINKTAELCKIKQTIISKAEKPQQTKPTTITDFKTVTLTKIIHPYDLKPIASQIKVSNITQNQEGTTITNNIELPKFCTQEEKEEMAKSLNTMSNKIPIEKINICSQYEISNNKISEYTPYFKSQKYDLKNNEKDIMIGYIIKSFPITKSLAKKLAFSKSDVFVDKFELDEVKLKYVYLNYNEMNEANGLNIEYENKIQFVKSNYHVALAKIRINKMEKTLRLDRTVEQKYDSNGDDEIFQEYSTIPANGTDSIDGGVFYSGAVNEMFKGVNFYEEFGFRIDLTLRNNSNFNSNIIDKISLYKGIVNLHNCPNVYTTSKSNKEIRKNNSDNITTYANKDILPFYYLYCTKKFYYEEYSGLFQSIYNKNKNTKSSISLLNSKLAVSKCNDEFSTKKVAVSEEIKSFYDNITKMKEEEERKRQYENISNLIKEIVSELNNEKYKDNLEIMNNTNILYNSTSTNPSLTNSNSNSTIVNEGSQFSPTFKALFNKSSDYEIASAQYYLREGIYADENNKIRSLANDEIILKHSKLIIVKDFKLYKRVFSKSFLTGYTFKLKEIETNELIVNLKAEISIIEKLVINSCGGINYENNPFNKEFSELNLPILTAFESYLKIYEYIEYDASRSNFDMKYKTNKNKAYIINTSGEFLIIKNHILNDFFLFENTQTQLKLKPSILNPKQDLLLRNQYEKLDKSKIVINKSTLTEEFYYNTEKINIEELNINVFGEIILTKTVTVSKLSEFYSNNKGEILCVVGREVDIKELEIKGLKIIGDAIVVDEKFNKIRDEYVVSGNSNNSDNNNDYDISKYTNLLIGNSRISSFSNSNNSIDSNKATNSTIVTTPIKIFKKEVLKLDLRNVLIDPKSKKLISETKTEYAIKFLNEACQEYNQQCQDRYLTSLKTTTGLNQDFLSIVELNLEGNLLISGLSKVFLNKLEPEIENVAELTNPLKIFFDVDGECSLIRYERSIENKENSNNEKRMIALNTYNNTSLLMSNSTNTDNDDINNLVNQIELEMKKSSLTELSYLQNFVSDSIKNISYVKSTVNTQLLKIVINPLEEVFKVIPYIKKDPKYFVEYVVDNVTKFENKVIREKDTLTKIDNFFDIISINKEKKKFVLKNNKEVEFKGIMINDKGEIVNSDGSKYNYSSIINDIDKDFYKKITDEDDLDKEYKVHVKGEIVYNDNNKDNKSKNDTSTSTTVENTKKPSTEVVVKKEDDKEIETAVKPGIDVDISNKEKKEESKNIETSVKPGIDVDNSNKEKKEESKNIEPPKNNTISETKIVPTPIYDTKNNSTNITNTTDAINTDFPNKNNTQNNTNDELKQDSTKVSNNTQPIKANITKDDSTKETNLEEELFDTSKVTKPQANNTTTEDISTVKKEKDPIKVTQTIPTESDTGATNKTSSTTPISLPETKNNTQTVQTPISTQQNTTKLPITDTKIETTTKEEIEKEVSKIDPESSLYKDIDTLIKEDELNEHVQTEYIADFPSLREKSLKGELEDKLHDMEVKYLNNSKDIELVENNKEDEIQDSNDGKKKALLNVYVKNKKEFIASNSSSTDNNINTLIKKLKDKINNVIYYLIKLAEYYNNTEKSDSGSKKNDITQQSSNNTTNNSGNSAQNNSESNNSGKGNTSTNNNSNGGTASQSSSNNSNSSNNNSTNSASTEAIKNASNGTSNNKNTNQMADTTASTNSKNKDQDIKPENELINKDLEREIIKALELKYAEIIEENNNKNTKDESKSKDSNTNTSTNASNASAISDSTSVYEDPNVIKNLLKGEDSKPTIAYETVTLSKLMDTRLGKAAKSVYENNSCDNWFKLSK